MRICTAEVFKAVAGYEGRYEVSNTGLIRRVYQPKSGRYKKGEILNPCKDKDGYYRTILTSDRGRRKNCMVHRLVAEAFVSNPSNNPVVNHIDGDKTNNHESNLEWVTVLQNNLHALRTGLRKHPPGDLHHMAKITESQVKGLIKTYRVSKVTQYDLAEKYGISQSQVNRILKGVRWKHLETTR